jgi:subtilisin family serine protease
VAATGRSGTLASWSNYGVSSVDVAAPGSGILSTVPGGKYQSMTGTSMSTPFVTGAVALLLAQNSSRTVSQLKSLIIKGADQSSALRGTSVSAGELDVANALAGKAGTVVSAPPTETRPIYGRRPGYGWPRFRGGFFSTEPIGESYDSD